MCTAIKDNHLFGRTLDLEQPYGEHVVITPRKYPLTFLYEAPIYRHYAMIGAAHISDAIPLYYDGMNETGLCAAALRLPAITHYHEKKSKGVNLASYELISWILCNFESAKNAKDALRDVNITHDRFSETLPATPLHWLVCDREESFVIESCEDGVHIYDDPYDALTNAPDFPTQCKMERKHGEEIAGELSSTSRFIRAVYTRENTAPADGEIESVSRFFHVLGTVNQPDGLFKAEDKRIRTVYTSCMDTESLTYYFTTYSCRKIRAVRMKNAHLDLEEITAFPMKRDEWIHFFN